MTSRKKTIEHLGCYYQLINYTGLNHYLKDDKILFNTILFKVNNNLLLKDTIKNSLYFYQVEDLVCNI